MPTHHPTYDYRLGSEYADSSNDTTHTHTQQQRTIVCGQPAPAGIRNNMKLLSAEDFDAVLEWLDKFELASKVRSTSCVSSKALGRDFSDCGTAG